MSCCRRAITTPPRIYCLHAEWCRARRAPTSAASTAAVTVPGHAACKQAMKAIVAPYSNVSKLGKDSDRKPPPPPSKPPNGQCDTSVGSLPKGAPNVIPVEIAASLHIQEERRGRIRLGVKKTEKQRIRKIRRQDSGR